MAATISSFGWAACLSSAWAVIMDESTSANIFKQRSFPFLPLFLALLRVWNAASVVIFSGPRVWTIGFSSIIRWCCPPPVTECSHTIPDTVEPVYNSPVLSGQFSKSWFFTHTNAVSVTCIMCPPLLSIHGHPVAVTCWSFFVIFTCIKWPHLNGD